jgi:hypothetical protein
MMKSKAERISKLALRYSKLQKDIEKEGLNDVSEKMKDAAMLLVNHGLKEFSKENYNE